MNILLCFNFVICCLIISGVARWTYKFIETINSGEFVWVQPAVTLTGVITLGVGYPLLLHETYLIPVAIGGGIALIQFGYECCVKPALKIFAFTCLLLDHFMDKVSVKLGVSLVSNDNKVTTETTDSDTKKVHTM
jgi:hypothetical protein